MDAIGSIDVEKLILAGRQAGATFLALFGSHARGNPRPESDVDVLVRFGEAKSLLDLASIENDLSESIGRKVDLVTEGAVSPALRKAIAADLVVLLDHGT